MIVFGFSGPVLSEGLRVQMKVKEFTVLSYKTWSGGTKDDSLGTEMI